MTKWPPVRCTRIDFLPILQVRKWLAGREPGGRDTRDTYETGDDPAHDRAGRVAVAEAADRQPERRLVVVQVIGGAPDCERDRILCRETDPVAQDRALDQVRTYQGRCDALVLMPFVRTELGRALRKLASEWDVPWLSCTGKGFDSMERALRTAFDLGAERIPTERGVPRR